MNSVFLINDTTLALDNPLHFRCNLIEIIQKGIRELQYDINRKAAKIPALLSCKIGKYEYLTGENNITF